MGLQNSCTTAVWAAVPWHTVARRAWAGPGLLPGASAHPVGSARYLCCSTMFPTASTLLATL